MLSERSQTQTPYVVRFHLFETSRKSKTVDRLVEVKAWKEGTVGSDCLMSMIFLFGPMKMFWSYIVLTIPPHCEGDKYH
jgi:hypothetical protein